MAFDENRITYFASTDARNRHVPFGIKAKDRTRHVYVIGKTGMGKSTLLENMAIQDIQNGEGLAFIDPHGKTAQLLLEYVPQERIKDVVYFAPFDLENPIAFNVMEDIGPDKRHLVVSGLMSAFEKIWVDAWSARMAYILQNTLHALLEYPGATLLGVNKMLTDKEYRKAVVANISDPTVKSFWVDEFAKYTDKFAAEATPAIQNKVGQFTSNPLIRNIIGQPKSSFDIRKIMDEKKILIINLSKGLVGENNANLLGSMLVTKIYLAAMSRADASEKSLSRLPNFYLYVDEFQSFANKSFADILSEARKYKLNLTIAHQYVEQMEEEVRAAVFGNVGTMIAFRVGAFDAEILEKEFAPVFTAEDMVNLGFAQIYLKLMIDGVSSQPFSAITNPPIAKNAISYRDDVIQASREQFAGERKRVEEEIGKQLMGVGSGAFSSSPNSGEKLPSKEIPVKKEVPRVDNKPTENGFKNNHNHNHSNGHNNGGRSSAFDNNRNIKSDFKKREEKVAKSEEHLSALRATLAGMVGEPELAIKEETKPKEVVVTEVIQSKLPVVAITQSKINGENKNHNNHSNFAKNRNDRPISNTGHAKTNDLKNNSEHKNALASLLKELQDKEKAKEEENKNSEVPRDDSIPPTQGASSEKKMSPEELKAMLHVDDVSEK